MSLDENFTVKVEGIESLESYPHRIVSCSVTVGGIQDSNHPVRNNYDEIIQNPAQSYVTGNNVHIPNFQQQAGDFPEFCSAQQVSKPYTQGLFDYRSCKGNALLYYLSFMEKCNFQSFAAAFDHIFNAENMTDTLNKSGLKSVKRYALLYLDYLGYIDFDHLQKQIYINKPQMMLIPDKTEIKAYLTGARTEEFVSGLIEYSKQESINLSLVKQDKFFECYLLPDTIILTPQNRPHATAGLMALEKLAQRFGICFDFIDRPVRQPRIVQWGLRDFSAKLNDYRNNMFEKRKTAETDYPFNRAIFETDTLTFKRSEEGELIDRELSLVKYNIHYEWLYRFWHNSSCYDVDRSWGHFLLLSGRKKNVIYYDEENKILGAPSCVHLPKFIAKSLVLLSGRIPSFQKITVNGYCISYLLYKNVPKTFADNLFRKLEQTVQSYKFNVK